VAKLTGSKGRPSLLGSTMYKLGPLQLKFWYLVFFRLFFCVFRGVFIFLCSTDIYAIQRFTIVLNFVSEFWLVGTLQLSFPPRVKPLVTPLIRVRDLWKKLKNHESNLFSSWNERKCRKNKNPVNIRFVAKTSDVRNLSDNITSDVMLKYQKWQH